MQSGTRRNSLLALLLLALISLLTLIFAWAGSPQGNTLRFELAKTAMQVLAVAVLGSVATLAVSAYQQSQTQDAKRRDQKLEHWHRHVENAKDKRTRQDDLLRSLLQETVVTYHRVKRLRRLLAAETKDSAGGHISRATYDKHMAELNDAQLEFEKYTRLAPFIDDDRLERSREPTLRDEDMPRLYSLATYYRSIEAYLNRIIDEYKEVRHSVADDKGTSIRQFKRLSQFVYVRDDFVKGAADNMDKIIATLQQAILQPLLLPTPQDEDGQRPST